LIIDSGSLLLRASLLLKADDALKRCGGDRSALLPAACHGSFLLLLVDREKNNNNNRYATLYVMTCCTAQHVSFGAVLRVASVTQKERQGR